MDFGFWALPLAGSPLFNLLMYGVYARTRSSFLFCESFIFLCAYTSLPENFFSQRPS